DRVRVEDGGQCPARGEHGPVATQRLLVAESLADPDQEGHLVGLARGPLQVAVQAGRDGLTGGLVQSPYGGGEQFIPPDGAHVLLNDRVEREGELPRELLSLQPQTLAGVEFDGLLRKR